MKNLFFLFLVIAFTNVAQADIARNCYASLDVYIKDNGANRNISLATVVGKGNCANQLYANKCRENARKAINNCLTDTWDNRHVDAIQNSCDSIINGSSHSGAKLSWDGIIPIDQDNRLTARGAYQVCCVNRKFADKVNVQFGGRITGDQKCASVKIGNNQYQDEYAFSDYVMNCNQLRDQGLCNQAN